MPRNIYWNVLHSNLPDIWKCLQQYWCYGMVLNLKYAKSVKACQLRYWHLRHYYFTPLTLERRKYLGIFGRWRQTTFYCNFDSKLNVSRTIPTICFSDILAIQYLPVSQICRHRIFDIEFLNSPFPAKLKTICSENENASRIIFLWNVAVSK